MVSRGYIAIHRKILDWRWYSDPITKILFIHLLLTASWKDDEWRGIKIKRGQCITGRKQLAEDLGCSERQIRTALAHLKSTNEVTIETTSRYSMITVEKYDDYQCMAMESVQQDDHQNVQPSTTSKEYKKKKKDIALDAVDEVFDTLWQLYPLKRSKDRVKATHKKLIAEIGFEKMKRALDRYLDYQKDTAFLMHGGRFFTSGYKDYLDENYVPLINKDERDQRLDNAFKLI